MLTARDDRLDAVLAELLERDGGPARAAAFAAHPDLADDLREFLADHDRLTKPPDATPPTRFGNYELVREVARGGMGAVWEARQLSPPRRCAVKVLRADAAGTADDRARFAAEAAAAARLCHPHIAAVYDAGEVPADTGSPGPPRQFLAMEFVAGPNLADYCGGAPIPARAAARALADVADAVSHAHARGVLHRDLKPANVLLDPAADRAGADPCDPEEEGSIPVAKVTDFGLAKRFAAGGGGDDEGDDETASDLTRTGQIVGTPAYMAPEQAGAGEVGVAADVYGLGAVLYHLLTGRAPFKDEEGVGPLGVLRQVLDAAPLPPRGVNPRADKALEAVCLRCLRKDPAARYGGAAEVAAEMRRFLAGEPVQAARGGVAGLAGRAYTALTASRHEDHFRYWGNALLAFAAVVAAAHAAIFLAERSGAGFLAAHLLPGAAMLGALGVVVWFARRGGHGPLPADGVERPVWAIWVGYFVARGMLTLLAWRQGWATGPTYAVAALLAGAAFHTLGGHAWGVCYLIAGAFFAAALPLAAAGAWAVPAFGALWTAVLVWLGLRYRRLGREHRPPNEERPAPEAG